LFIKIKLERFSDALSLQSLPLVGGGQVGVSDSLRPHPNPLLRGEGIMVIKHRKTSPVGVGNDPDAGQHLDA